jgi:hypothetical protein
MNVMIVSLTREEFDRLVTAEVFEGTDNTTETFGSGGGASKAAPMGEELKGKTTVEELYTTNENGDIVEL